MASMLQAWVIGIPVMFVVNGDPRAEFLVLSCVIFVVSMALLLLIMWPKFLLRKTKRKRRSSFDSGVEATADDIDKPRKPVHISGIGTVPGDSDRSLFRDDGNESISDLLSVDGGESHIGVKVYANASDQKNAVLQANLATVRREKQDLLDEMKLLVDRAGDEDKIERKLLEESIGKFTGEQRWSSNVVLLDGN
mmetsp:Transcript_5579/g.11777  ORF Transcript_5579/g.11777 Transcript_5579/m.11777 type:complete len:194 (-) Transcript_5579:34-615(-)